VDARKPDPLDFVCPLCGAEVQRACTGYVPPGQKIHYVRVMMAAKSRLPS
jgi:hypothetical protein